jgi:L-ascorbate metabolism protein UlaG (beta-lactamase superfamily)
VIGFALRWDGQRYGALWISGGTVLYGGVREVADRLRVGVALLHLGGVGFPVTGAVRYTMTARNAVDLCRLVRPRTAVPVHYEGWKHFQEPPPMIERELAEAPADVQRSIRWLPIGTPTDLRPRLRPGHPRSGLTCSIPTNSTTSPAPSGSTSSRCSATI